MVAVLVVELGPLPANALRGQKAIGAVGVSPLQSSAVAGCVFPRQFGQEAALISGRWNQCEAAPRPGAYVGDVHRAGSA
jgi:hypothetical protein